MSLAPASCQPVPLLLLAVVLVPPAVRLLPASHDAGCRPSSRNCSGRRACGGQGQGPSFKCADKTSR